MDTELRSAKQEKNADHRFRNARFSALGLPCPFLSPFAGLNLRDHLSVKPVPHKPLINFSEGILQKMAQYATEQITHAELVNYLYSQGTENPEQFIQDREPLFSAIRSVIDKHKDDST